MRPTNLFPYQIKIPIDKNEYDRMSGNRPWDKWTFENIGLPYFDIPDYDNGVWYSDLEYEPEFAMIFNFKYETDAMFFKLRWE